MNFFNARYYFSLILLFSLTVTLFSQQNESLDLTNNSWVNIGDLDIQGNQITVEALYYFDNDVRGNIISKHTNPRDVNYLFRPFEFILTTGSQFLAVDNPTTFMPNQWYHIAGTYDGTMARYYVDGCLVNELPLTGNLVQNNLATAIGARSQFSDEQFVGQLDEVRIWNVARNQTELQQNSLDLPNPQSQSGLVAYYKFENDLTNAQGNTTWNGTAVGNPQFTTNTINYNEPQCAPCGIDENLAAYFPMNNSPNDVINGNTGTLNGATLTTDRFGNENAAYEFDGRDDFIDYGDSTEYRFAGDYSISLWMFMPSEEPQFGNLIQKRVPASPFNTYSIVMASGQGNSSGVMKGSYPAFVHRSDGNQVQEKRFFRPNDVISVGWHQIIVTNQKDGQAFIYVDSELVGETQSTNGTANIIGQSLLVGGNPDVNDSFQGKIDDIRLYQRFLSRQEVGVLYDCEKPADDPCTNNGGDTDQDGICATEDCNDNDPNIGTTQPEGTSCNDNNPNTINDIILADGCTCEGTAMPTIGSTDILQDSFIVTGKGSVNTKDTLWEASNVFAISATPIPAIDLLLPTDTSLTWNPASVINRCASTWVNPRAFSNQINQGNWISNATNPCGTPAGNRNTYLFYRTRFSLPVDFDVNNTPFSLSVSAFADNRIGAVYINGAIQEIPQLPGGNFRSGVQFILNQNWQAGENIISFLVWNGVGDSFNPEGLLALLRISNDDDGDGIVNLEDNCPQTPNPDQLNADNDTAGALCDCDDSPATGASCTDGCQVFYVDADMDGFGSSADSVVTCIAPMGYVDNKMDCDDGDGTKNPNSTEIANDGIDQDCDGMDLIETESCNPADCPGIPILLNDWMQEGALENGNWTVSEDGQTVFQSINGGPTFFVSPSDFMNTTINGSFRVLDRGDDDFIGFVIGYQMPDTSNLNQFDFILFDWKRANQSGGREGFALSKISGEVIPDELGEVFWEKIEHPALTLLATDFSTTKGWAARTLYNFELEYTASNLKISIDNNLIFDVAGNFQPGRFGFYNYSQEDVEYMSFTEQGTCSTFYADRILFVSGKSELPLVEQVFLENPKIEQIT